MNTRTRLTFVATAVVIVLLLSALPAFAKDKGKDKHGVAATGKQHQMKIKKWPHKGDFDRDGLKNIDEFRCGTNPRRADTDKDGVIDGLEDPDGDGLVNIAEIDSKTNPRRADTDKDGIKDADEDPDKDGLTNGQEYLCDTNPRRADTDKDGIKDADENPDADGLTNAEEFAQGCDPLDSDSNDDGVLDGQEVVVETRAEVVGNECRLTARSPRRDAASRLRRYRHRHSRLVSTRPRSRRPHGDRLPTSTTRCSSTPAPSSSGPRA